jgi:rRNA maturation protein Nop10
MDSFDRAWDVVKSKEIDEDSREWERIVDEAYKNPDECPKCGLLSLLSFPASFSVDFSGFKYRLNARKECVNNECQYMEDSE